MQFWRFYFASLVLRLLIPSFVPGWQCSASLCWLPQGVLLLMILCLSCQSGWDTSSSSLQRSCAGLGAGRRAFCLSIGPRSSPGLCEGWWQMVLPAGALPGYLSLFSSSRKRWHLAFMKRPGWCVTFTFICHPSCVLLSLWEVDRGKIKPALDPNPHCVRYLCSHLFTFPC